MIEISIFLELTVKIPFQKMVLRTCDADPVSSPLLTITILTIIALFLQIFLLIFTIHHLRKQPEISKVGKLCVFSQSIGFLFLLYQLLLSGTGLSSIYNWHKTLISCQILDYGLTALFVIFNYGSLILFWALRLKLSFKGTPWQVTKKAKKVHSIPPPPP